MITLDKIILESLISRNLKDVVGFRDSVPRIRDIYSKAMDDMGNLFNPLNIPEIDYKSIASASAVIAQSEKIKLWLGSAHTALGYVVNEHQMLSDRYSFICSRINNEMEVFRQSILEMLNYSCHYIFSQAAKSTKDSNCGRIGKFITLPYFLESCQMYNGPMFLRASTSGDILFSNMESIGSIPFLDMPSVKVLDINNSISITLTCSFQEMQLNGIYLKLLNDNVTIDVTVFNKSTPIYKDSQSSNEVFFNFEPMRATSIVFSVSATNANPSKPYSLQISMLELFNQIVFSQRGSFVSVPYTINEVAEINSLSLTHKNDGDLNQTNSIQYLSVQTDINSTNFARTEQESKLDISSYKYKYSVTLDGFNRNLGHDVNFYGKTFYKLPLPKDVPTLWDMDVKNAIIFFGTNREYTVNTENISNLSDPYENWTRVGNYYKTMLANYEENIVVDFGSKTCIFNGRNVTGRVSIPIGISSVEIHVKDIDFKFGGGLENERYNGIKYSSAVYSDPLYPSNMAYALGGLPEYTGGNLSEELSEKEFYISTASSALVNEPFIPMSMSVYDSKGRPYDLVISKAPSVPGTFSIEPNKGRVRICPKHPDTFKLRYRRCDLGIRPAGILFNRLLTFMPMKSMVNMLKYNSTDKSLFETYFTLDGDQNERYIMFPDISYATQRNISHAILSYNLKSDKLYSSVQIDLESKSKFLTPLINSVYIMGS